MHVDGSASPGEQTHAQSPSSTSVADTLMAPEIRWTIQTLVAGLHTDVNWRVKGQNNGADDAMMSRKTKSLEPAEPGIKSSPQTL